MQTYVHECTHANVFTESLFCTCMHPQAVSEKRKHHEDFFGLFDVIVTGDDSALKKGKPAPDIFLLALERLNAHYAQQNGNAHTPMQAHECVVFEDSEAGVTAGVNAVSCVWMYTCMKQTHVCMYVNTRLLMCVRQGWYTQLIHMY